MGSIVYDFLNDSLLFDPGLIASQFDGMADNGLLIELQRYRDFCVKHLNVLFEEVAAEEGKLKMYAGSAADARLLKQGAFYLDNVIVTDPLFELTEPRHQSSSAWSSFFGMPRREGVDRKAIAFAAKAMRDSRPMVAQGYVNYFPTSLYSETPSELPIYASDNGFEDGLPQHILSMYKAAANVRSVIPSPGGLLVQKELNLGRRIHIDFDAIATGKAFGYNLVDQEISAIDEATRTFQATLRMPTELPSQAKFNSWVAQSINRSASTHFSDLTKDIRWSARFGAQYLTRSSFDASILEVTDQIALGSIATVTTNSLLNLELSYFDKVTVVNLMDARADGDAFARFRIQLEKQFRELRLEDDLEKRRIKTENAMHELLEIQRTEIDSAIRRIKRKAILGGLSTGLSLYAAIPTSGLSLLGTIYAAYAGYRTYEEYRLATKENPAYFLWKAGGSKSLR